MILDCCNWTYRPSGHYWDYYPGALLFLSQVTTSSSSNFIFQQIYNAHILTNHYTCNIIRWWLSEKCKDHLADNQFI